VEDLIAACATTWETDPAACRAFAAQLGLAIDARITDAVVARLAVYNDDRKRSRLTPGDILRVTLAAADAEDGYAIRHAGVSQHGRTTLVLAVRPAGRDEIVVSFGSCTAERPSPGGAWPALAPWRDHGMKNRDKTQAFLADPDVSRVTIPLVARAPRPTRASGDELLAQILADPDDDGARLVYADHLAEHGDPRGEYLVAVLRDPRSPRAIELFGKHRDEWQRDALQFCSSVQWARGFICAVTAKGAAFARHGAKLLAREPIEELVLTSPSIRDLKKLRDCEALARLRVIRMASPCAIGSIEDLAPLSELLHSPHLGMQREIELGISLWVEVYGDELRVFDDLVWPATKLTVRCREVADEQRDVLIDSLACATVRELVIA